MKLGVLFAAVVVVLLAVVAILALRGPRPDVPPLFAGGYYSVEDGEGGYRVARILAEEDDVVHVRVYANRFAERPQSLVLTSLTLGRTDDPKGFGIGHIPLPRADFAAWKPVYLHLRAPLTPQELEGYEAWRRLAGSR